MSPENLKKNFSAVIGIYHYFLDGEHPYPRLKGLTEEQFLAHLEFATKHFSVIPLAQYVAFLKGEVSHLPPRPFIFTFDDGLKEHIRVVAPLLKKFNCPGTFFIATAPIEEESVLLVHKTHLLLQQFSIEELKERAFQYLSEEYKLKFTDKTFRETAKARYKYDTEDTATFKYLLNRALPPVLRADIVGRVFATSFPKEKEIVEKFYLSRKDIADLSEQGFEIGSHGRTHPVFSLLSGAQKQDELVGSKRILESIIKKPVNGISYPYGGEGEFDDETIAIAKKAGYQYGVTAIKKVNYDKPDPFKILRVDANDVLTIGNELAL